MGDDIKDVANKGLEGAKTEGNKIANGTKDAISALNDAVNGNGANMVQLSYMGLFMTVLAIFNR